jgi:hypothetical protein
VVGVEVAAMPITFQGASAADMLLRQLHEVTAVGARGKARTAVEGACKWHADG